MHVASTDVYMYGANWAAKANLLGSSAGRALPTFKPCAECIARLRRMPAAALPGVPCAEAARAARVGTAPAPSPAAAPGCCAYQLPCPASSHDCHRRFRILQSWHSRLRILAHNVVDVHAVQLCRVQHHSFVNTHAAAAATVQLRGRHLPALQ
jgi:hypothetical protein